jgi:uncharacterized protein
VTVRTAITRSCAAAQAGGPPRRSITRGAAAFARRAGGWGARLLAGGSFAFLLLMAAGARADQSPPNGAFQVPPWQGPVNDYAHLLTPEQSQALEQKLRAHEASKQQRFALLTVPSLQGLPIDTFGIKVAENWKLGSQKGDEGLILIIAPTERKSRIEVGYGLEGQIPDAIASRVLREVLTPAFQQQQYAEGINASFDSLIRAGGGTPVQVQPQTQPRSARRTRPSGALALLAPLILPLILFLLFSGGGRGGGRRRRGGFFVGPFIGGGFGGGGGGGGSWGGFGGGGGGGGDDYRGGGGGFGGGGASGSW